MAKKAIKPKKSSPTRPKKGLYIFHVYGHFTLQLTLDETEVVCEGGDIEPRESVVREQENIIEELLAESSDVTTVRLTFLVFDATYAPTMI